MQRNKSNKQGDCKNKQRGGGVANLVKKIGYFARKFLWRIWVENLFLPVTPMTLGSVDWTSRDRWE